MDMGKQGAVECLDKGAEELLNEGVVECLDKVNKDEMENVKKEMREEFEWELEDKLSTFKILYFGKLIHLQFSKVTFLNSG